MSKRFATVTTFMISFFATSALGCAVMRSVAGGGFGSRLRRIGGFGSRLRRIGGDTGMSTAEYAVGTIAACAFAVVLYQVVTGDSIVSALQDLITSALSSLS